MEYTKLNEILREFLKYNGYKSTLEALDNDEKSRLSTNRISKKNLPQGLKVYSIILLGR